MDIKFSIITVCYNSEKTILETIESVQNQTYKNYEHIIVDGKSTDKTLEIVSDYMKKSDKVILLSEKDTGIYNAMNKGIALATGELIVFLNSDDTFEVDALNLIKSNYNNNLDLIYGNVYWQREFKNNIYEKEINLNPNIADNHGLMTKNHLDKIKNGHNATFVKSNIMKKNLFDENYKICSDYKFFLNMYKQKRRIKYIPYRITNMKMGGVSTTQLKLGLEEHISCEREVLGNTELNYVRELIKIKLNQIAIKCITLLPESLYIKLRYIRTGWKIKNI
ncbi:glycosyltransferase family 2 protein [Clostridium perfringens]|nr:glycosyltransferase [Clostridium perfringens]